MADATTKKKGAFAALNQEVLTADRKAIEDVRHHPRRGYYQGPMLDDDQLIVPWLVYVAPFTKEALKAHIEAVAAKLNLDDEIVEAALADVDRAYNVYGSKDSEKRIGLRRMADTNEGGHAYRWVATSDFRQCFRWKRSGKGKSVVSAEALSMDDIDIDIDED